MACGDKKAAFRVAILDPELTLTQPARVTALTGIDAMAHALETYVTTRRNAISLCFSREAWRLLSGHFHRVLQDPQDLTARGAMQLGACFSGLAIENSMLGATHALANPLTATYQIPHGQAIATMLPHVLRYNGQQVLSWYEELDRPPLEDSDPGGIRRGASGVFCDRRHAPRRLALEPGRTGCSPRKLARSCGVGSQTMDRGVQSPRRPPCGSVRPVRGRVFIDELKGSRSFDRVPAKSTNSTNTRGPLMNRRLVFLLLGIGCLMASLSSAGPWAEESAADRSPTPPTQTAESWPMFRGNSLATGVAISPLPDDLELLWRYEVPNGAFEGTPAITDGVVYLGDLDGALFALDLATGREMWKHTTESGFPASPSVADGRVFIGDYDGRFHCVEARLASRSGSMKPNAEINSCANFYQGTRAVWLSGCHALLPERGER